jgi:pyruvate/2-oxoglutarate/acetoin dehydrogenase E1 component
MPHTKPAGAIVIKKNGEATSGLMLQPQVESYLANVLANKADRIANLKQSLNQAFDGNGKATSTYKFAGEPVWHASSGNSQKSVSLFYYMNGTTMTVVAMGEHADAKGVTQYSLSDYGQLAGDFKAGRILKL